MSSRITSGRLVAAVALVAALTLSWAGAAFAGPAGAVPEPTLGLAALRSKLDASPTGTLVGYFKTVVRGSTIVTIPVDVLAVAGDTSDSLILFEAKGEKIALYGGIVAGMSGSPIYVEDEGVDKVIGALSYGESFTLGGTGLATPIESMLRLTTDYAPRVQFLSAPVLASGRLVDRVVISSDPSLLKGVASPTAFVGRALASVFIGGLEPGSRVYADVKKGLEDSGVSVMQLDVPLSSGISTFTTELVPGASVAALGIRGDVWMGGIGTVTWADGDTVLAFGHPAFYTGDAALYMCNAWISGVWPSSYVPSKVGYPTAVRGTITQDRTAGIMGVTDSLPTESLFTAQAVMADNGREASSTVYVSSQLLERADDYGTMYGVPSAAAYVAINRLPEFDQEVASGSACTTTTVLVSDGVQEYTVRMVGMVDDSYDLGSAVGYDVERAVFALLDVIDDGVEAPPHIVSANVEASVSTSRSNARIVGVALADPLHEGENRVTVSMLAHGIAATRTIDTTITVPEGTPLVGTISASNAWPEMDMDEEPTAPAGRPTTAEIVDELNAELPANCLVVSFAPLDPEASEDSDPIEAIESTTTLPWVVNGKSTTAITQITAEAMPGTVSYGGSTAVSGFITGPTKAATVQVYGTRAGSSVETLLAEQPADKIDGELTYEIYLPTLTANTEVRVHVDGGVGYTPADAFTYVDVRAKVRLSASALNIRFGRRVTFTARVSPRTARGSVRFQYYDAGQRRWRTVATKSLRPGAAYSTATAQWMPRWGKRKWRAVFGGDMRNVGSTSPSLTTWAH